MPQSELKLDDMLALDRNRRAADRTLMAWVRTALSMLGFGFFIYKFFQVFIERSTVAAALRPQSPRNVACTHRPRNLCCRGSGDSTLELRKELKERSAL